MWDCFKPSPSGNPRAMFAFGNMTQTDGQMDEQGHGWTHTHALDVAESPPVKARLPLGENHYPEARSWVPGVMPAILADNLVSWDTRQAMESMGLSFLISKMGTKRRWNQGAMETARDTLSGMFSLQIKENSRGGLVIYKISTCFKLFLPLFHFLTE